MKIFGINFETKRFLRNTISDLAMDLDCCEGALEACEDELTHMQQQFPFDLYQIVYDVALKNDKGRYTKTNPSLAYSTITEVVVDEKNYFSLVERFRRNDVFISYKDAEAYLKSICNHN